MRALEMQWGWYQDGHASVKKTQPEMAALRFYCETFGKFPPGTDRHKKRNYRQVFNLGDSFDR